MAPPLAVDQQRCDSDGYGLARVTCPAGSTWHITKYTVQVIGWELGDAQPQCNVYMGSVSPGSLIEGTDSGQKDTSDSVDELLVGGESLVAEWVGAEPGAYVVLRVVGERQTT